MKLKYTLMAAAAMVAMAYQAQAIVIPSITNYSRLNVALTIKTNASLPTVNQIHRWTFKTAKIDNKALLALFQQSQYANMTFPTGSFLAIGWQGGYWGDVLVMDKNGTNILFDATVNFGGSNTNYLFITFWNGTYGNNNNGFGAGSGASYEKNPGSYYWTSYNNAYFEFDDFSSDTFLYGDGPDVEHWKENWDANGNYIGWSATEMFNPSGADSNEMMNGNNYSSVDGTISANGRGDGINPIQF